MGRLYDLIKDKYEALVNFQNSQESNYLDSMKFNNLYDAMLNTRYVDYILSYVHHNRKYFFGSNEAYKNFIKENDDVFTKNEMSIPTIELGDYGYLNAKDYDFVKMFDTIEKAIGEKKTDELIENYHNYIPPMLKDVVHPYEEAIDGIISDIKDYGFQESELKEFEESLKYAKEELVEKRDDGEIDTIIDKLSLSRDNIAKNKIIEYGNKHGLDGTKLKACDDKSRALVFNANTADKQELLSNLLNNKPKYTIDFKQKLLKLDELINENGLLKIPQAGESDRKEYGFIDYFAKANELKNLINNHLKIDDFGDKVDSIVNINKCSKELKEVASKYDKIIDYIKENFDLNEISLPGNIYSGRKYDSSKDGLDYYIPNLPKRWDNLNAPYGVVLNGYCQLMAACKFFNIPLKEYLDDPVKGYLKGSKAEFDKEDKQYLLAREGNPLGKRIAHALIMDENAYISTMMKCGTLNRGFEFIDTTMDKDKNTIDTMITIQSGISLFQVYNHESNKLFNAKDYDSIKNLFALGNETDNLFSVSNNYFDENMKRGTLAKTYSDKISSIRNVNPLNESRRIMDTLKNFMIERKYIYDNKNKVFNSKNIRLQEPFKPATLFVSAKLYFNDYLYKNNINLLSLGNKERQEVFDFLNDPVSAFMKKYSKDAPSLFRVEKGKQIESFDSIRQEFKQEFGKLYKENGDNFVNKFNEINNSSDKLNRGKSIANIIEDNKRNFIKRWFSSSSKEYRALKKSILASTDPSSPTYGDLNGSKAYAIKYLEHKLPLGTDRNSLSSNEKRRVEFCETIIKAADEIEKEKNKENENNIAIAIDNKEFQDKVKNDVDLELDYNLDMNNNEVQNEIEYKME